MKDPYSKSIKEPKGIMGGYVGKDPLREKARQMMKADLDASMVTPESYSADDNTKMRYYKKGGGVKALKAKMMKHERNETAAQEKRESKKTQALEKKLGVEGHENRRKIHKINHDHYGMAKHINGPKVKDVTVREAVQMKKGGKVKEGKLIKGLIMKGGDMKKTGKKMADGGNVYERHMLGEHPSRKVPHINYESEMRGEKPVKKAMAKGGCMKKGGTTKKMAMGGATKMNRRDGIYEKKTRKDYSK